MIPQQNMTNRYVHDLLYMGSNHDFFLEEVTRHPNVVDGFIVGQYWKVTLSTLDGRFTAAGPTPVESCRRAMEHFGVTFK